MGCANLWSKAPVVDYQLADGTVPTKNLNSRKVTASTDNMTLDARFTIASELRRQATDRQSQGRDALLAKKRGASAAAAPAKQPAKQVGLSNVSCMPECGSRACRHECGGCCAQDDAAQKGSQSGRRRRKAKGVALPGRVKVRPTAPTREAVQAKGEQRLVWAVQLAALHIWHSALTCCPAGKRRARGGKTRGGPAAATGPVPK